MIYLLINSLLPQPNPSSPEYKNIKSQITIKCELSLEGISIKTTGTDILVSPLQIDDSSLISAELHVQVEMFLPFLYIICLSLTSVTMRMPSGMLLFLNLDIVWNSHLFAISSISSSLGFSSRKSAIILTWPLRSWKIIFRRRLQWLVLHTVACMNR